MYEIVDIKKDEEYNPQFIIETELQNQVDRTSESLDLFIEFMLKESPDILSELLSRFIGRLSNYDGISLNDISFEYTPKNLETYPEVFELLRSVSLSLLNYKDHISTEKDGKISAPYWYLIRSVIIPAYLLVETLVSICSRSKAIELYKKSVDYATDHTHKIDESITNIEDLYKASSTASPTHTRTGFLTRNGAAGTKITRCMWFEILKEFGDPELGYAVACHYDFQAALYINKNFRLTRTKTLMQGDEMCDFCWHDISIDKNMKHPPERFWRELDDKI